MQHLLIRLVEFSKVWFKATQDWHKHPLVMSNKIINHPFKIITPLFQFYKSSGVAELRVSCSAFAFIYNWIQYVFFFYHNSRPWTYLPSSFLRKKKKYGIDSPLSYKQWFLNTYTFVYSNATKSQINGSTLTFVGKYKDIRFRMDDKELVKCLIPHWK